MTAIDRKRALRAALLAAVRDELHAAEAAHRATVAGATHEEAKPENDKDTRALEQSYLARGQAERVDELARGLTEVERMPLRVFGEADPIALGALAFATEDEADARRAFFVAPHGGGTALEGGAVQVVTPRSPLGRALLGKRAGDACEVIVAGKARELVIERVT
jgi:hypothetical protein